MTGIRPWAFLQVLEVFQLREAAIFDGRIVAPSIVGDHVHRCLVIKEHSVSGSADITTKAVFAVGADTDI